jgi:hypothetical protein
MKIYCGFEKLFGMDNVPFESISVYLRGVRYHSWLRHCATRQKAVGSNPDEVDLFQLT